MAFIGKERLQSLEATEAACVAHSTYVPFAEAIATELNQFSAADIEGHLDLAIGKVTEDEKRQRLSEELDKLDPLDRYTLLAKYFGDTAVKEALDEHRQRLVDRDDKTKMLARLRGQFSDTRRINLADIPEGTQTLFHLHGIADFKAAKSPRKFAKEYIPDLTIRAVSYGEDGFTILGHEVYTDFAQQGYRMYPRPQADEPVRLGGALGVKDKKAFDVSYGAALNIQYEGKEQELTLRHKKDYFDQYMVGIGAVTVDGETVMGDVPKQ
jgi:hypothetical protein